MGGRGSAEGVQAGLHPLALGGGAGIGGAADGGEVQGKGRRAALEHESVHGAHQAQADRPPFGVVLVPGQDVGCGSTGFPGPPRPR